MTPDIDALLTEPERGPKVEVDRYNRYRIPHPDTGKPTSWTRVTTLAKTLEDQHNLTLWKLRRAAIGVANTPSIAAAIVAVPDDNHTDNKRELDRLVEQAQERAGAGEKRDLGTALHRILERVDRGELRPDQVPAPWHGDVQSWLTEARHKKLTVNPDLLELCVVNPEMGVAGRFDMLLTTHDGHLVVADRKTGGYVSWLAFSMQFAAYATATHIWDGQELRPMPEVRQDYGLLVHQSAGTGQCRIWRLDLEIGYEACLIALDVRRKRATRQFDVGRPYDVPGDLEPDLQPAAAEPTVDQLRAWLTQRVDTLKAGHVDAAKALAMAWPAGVPTFKQAAAHTHAQLAQIEAALDRVEAQHGVPFGAPRPTNKQKAEAA